MKKIILVFVLAILFIACKKEDYANQEPDNYVTIELNGIYSFNENVDIINYTVVITIDGYSNYFEVNKTLENGFNGNLFKQTIKLNEDDIFSLEVFNNSENYSYVYINVYAGELSKKRIDFENNLFCEIASKYRYLNGIELLKVVADE